jgi:hypothetical protein
MMRWMTALDDGAVGDEGEHMHHPDRDTPIKTARRSLSGPFL